MNSTRDAGDFFGPFEPCKPGSHCVTLEKIYMEEQKLYKEVKVVTDLLLTVFLIAKHKNESSVLPIKDLI